MISVTAETSASVASASRANAFANEIFNAKNALELSFDNSADRGSVSISLLPV